MRNTVKKMKTGVGIILDSFVEDFFQEIYLEGNEEGRTM